MHVPELMERVRLVGMDEVYFVARVDYDSQVADLLPMMYAMRAVHDVPFAVIEEIPGSGPPGPLPN
jgi:hypothetical protein